VGKATVTNLTSPRVASITPLGWTTSIKATKGRDK
jgi:hypothetical protein